VLVKNQTVTSHNGVYVVTVQGSGSTNWVLTRASDYDNSVYGSAVAGNFTFIQEGTTQAATSWVQTSVGTQSPNDVTKIGTDAISFTQFSGAGTYLAGTGLSLTGTTFANTGVLSITSNTGLSINTSATGSVTLTNTGVTSLVAGTNVSLSGSTGAVTINVNGTVSTATTASNLAGTTPYSVPYQSGSATTLYVSPGTAGSVFVTNSTGSAPAWSTTPTITGTNFTGIPNGALTNNSVTIGSTNLALGGTATTLAGLTSVTATTFTGALSGNATTVTTNANLTGPITSVGNATSVASQTGTGTTFVMSNSPTLSTPNLGTPSTLILTNATGAPTWNQSTTGNAATATSVSGGTAGTIVFQSGASTTGFTAAGSPGQFLVSAGTGTPVWSQSIPYVDAGGTADAITATYSPAFTALTDGMTVAFGPTAANATTTPTLNINGLGAKTIVKNQGQALVAGDIAGSSAQLLVQYNATNTQWELINPQVSTYASNMFGGTTGQMTYQSAANTTAFTSGITVASTGKVTLAASTSVESIAIPNGTELAYIVGSAPASTTNIYANNGAVQLYTSNAANNFIANIAWSSGTTFNTATSTGDCNTYVLLVTQGSTAYYCTSVQIDGTTSGVTTKWQGGTAPTAGFASGIDAYSFTVIKTAASTYTVLAALTQF
jgi:hypothetical protein